MGSKFSAKELFDILVEELLNLSLGVIQLKSYLL